MDIAALLLAIVTATVFAFIIRASRPGNGKRAVALPGAVGGLRGAGTVVAAII